MPTKEKFIKPIKYIYPVKAHPTDWHGPMALRLRRLYYHRVESVKTCGQGRCENVIGIPWSEWAALGEEREHRNQHAQLAPLAAGLMGYGVDYLGKSYNDAIPVYGFGYIGVGVEDCGYFWFYPKL